MPVGVRQQIKLDCAFTSVQLDTLPRVLLLDLFPYKHLLSVMYCYVAAVLFFVSLIPIMNIPSGVIPANCKSQKPEEDYSQVFMLGFAAAYILFISHLAKINFHLFKLLSLFSFESNFSRNQNFFSTVLNFGTFPYIPIINYLYHSR